MKKALALTLALLMLLSFAACGATPAPSSASAPPSSEAASLPAPSGTSTAPVAKPTVDRSGAAIQLPEEINSIVVMAPSVTETIIALGDGDLIVATDTQSVGRQGLAEGLPAIDMQQPDAEQLAALQPDVIFVTSLSMVEGENPFQPLADLGICVVQIPTSDSIADIYLDLKFIAAALGKSAEGDDMVAELDAEIARIAAIGSGITDKKTVYFEIAAAPYAYSFGSGVFLNEMIEIIGAENVLANQTGWLSVEPESAVAANPDVILTNVNYIDDAVGEILAREGWEEVTAVQNEDVYYIDNMSSSLPNQNIYIALNQMAQAIYPELYS